MYFREVTTVKSKCNGNGMLHVASKAENPLLPYLPDRKNTRNRFRTNIEITLPSKFCGDGGTSLVIQWLRFCVSNAGGVGLIPGWGTRIPDAMQHDQKFKNK